jgi:UDP-N-acetylmuramoylalanine--D-glutamate ligase
MVKYITILKMDFLNKKVAVLGWGINGRDAVNYLLTKNASITVLDAKTKEELDFNGLNMSAVKLKLGKDYMGGLSEYDYIFRAPGIYRYLPEIIKAEKSGVIVTSSLKVFFDECPSKIIGVTGTKGKGTTSTLIYEIIKNTRNDVYLAGNIGYPVLELLNKLTPESIVVLELSSFQLIDMHKSPHLAVILNITSDHIDWHKNRQEYVQAKTNIVRYQNEEDYAIINFDYADSKNFDKLTKANKYYFSRKNEVKGVYVFRNNIYINIMDKRIDLGSTKKLLLRGVHNHENITAAICASCLAGAEIETIRKTVFSFKGLEHRLELVRTFNGVGFYNDSFSTNPDTTLAAVAAFSEPTTLILGGFNKGFNYDQMAKKITKFKNITNLILIGEISDILNKSFIKVGYKKKLLVLGKIDIKEIVRVSLEASPPGGVVLLSPATSSFDMFNNYKERGFKFKDAVNALS